MPTPYQSVFERFLPKLTDYSYINLTEEELNENLETYLLSAVVKFRYCRNKLSERDAANKLFNTDLSDEEMEILSTLMIVEYLTPKLISADLLQQTLNSKDFRLYSQANHIKETRELRNTMKKEADTMMINYNIYGRKLDEFL